MFTVRLISVTSDGCPRSVAVAALATALSLERLGCYFQAFDQALGQDQPALAPGGGLTARAREMNFKTNSVFVMRKSVL